jgi:DNA-directed RNA polymerase subunit RPC12/RpoP
MQGGVPLVELVPARCVSCGADLEFPDGLDIGHCMYCGSKIIIERAQPEIHYHGTGNLDNYLKLGDREYGTASDMERQGIVAQKRAAIESNFFFMVIIGLIILPLLGLIFHYSISIALFVIILILAIAYYPKMKENQESQVHNILASDIWKGANQDFWDHVLNAVKHYGKALEIDADSNRAISGHNGADYLRKKYYHMLDPHQQMLRKMATIEQQQQQQIQQQKKKSGCFIATAAYGNPFVGEIVILQNWRDSHLLPTRNGRLFVDFYYWISPTIANLISNSPILRKSVRIVLRPIVTFIKLRCRSF